MATYNSNDAHSLPSAPMGGASMVPPAPVQFAQHHQQSQHQQQSSQQMPRRGSQSSRPKSRSFSFRSDRSHSQKGVSVKLEPETHAEKEAKRLHSKADPSMAIFEAEPGRFPPPFIGPNPVISFYLSLRFPRCHGLFLFPSASFTFIFYAYPPTLLPLPRFHHRIIVLISGMQPPSQQQSSRPWPRSAALSTKTRTETPLVSFFFFLFFLSLLSPSLLLTLSVRSSRILTDRAHWHAHLLLISCQCPMPVPNARHIRSLAALHARVSHGCW